MRATRTAHVTAGLCGAIAALACLAPAAERVPETPPAREAFSRARDRAAGYAGPGREAPDPAGVREVLIGYFGPDDPRHPEAGDLWCAARMAVDEANARGGFRGTPFRLVAGWSDSPWTAGARHLTRMVYEDKVWAVLGGIDGPSTHLAEQVVAKARLTLVSPAATDKTVNLANVPWMFSCLPGDHLLAPPLATEVAARAGGKPFLLVSADDHDSHLFAVELSKCLSERGLAPCRHFEFRQEEPDLRELVARVLEPKAEAVILAAGARTSARLAAALRGGGFVGTIFGGPAMGRWRFLEEAGPAAEGVIFPLLYPPPGDPADFAQAFQARFGRPPDYAAAHAYDAVRLLLAAIGKAGLNRARIGDAVRDLSPWTGVTGAVTWDPLGSNTRAVRLGTIRQGAVRPLEAAAAAPPPPARGT